MYSILNKILLIIFVIVLGAAKAHSQFTSKLEIGANIGTLIYQGDLSPSLFGYTRSLRPAVGLYVSKPLDDYFSLRLNVVRGRIGADESVYSDPAWRRFRNLKFSSSVTEISGLLSWNLLGNTARSRNRKLSPYFFAGLGLSVLNVHRDWSRFDRSYFDSKSPAAVGLGIDTLSGVPGIVLVLPVGAGLRYAVSDRVGIHAEATYRITPSDYIDGFKYAGDPKSKDYYYSFSAGVSYRFGYNENDCPKIRL